ncbi:MAG: prepilin-type N-terminal cleavage/methylation domain-containing protein [Planctomycetota bacterium]
MFPGFTLVELLIVLVLAGLLTGLAAISLRHSMRISTIEQAADLIQAADRQCREQAERHGRPVTLRFSPGRGSWQRVVHASGEVSSAWAVELTESTDNRGGYTLGPGVRISRIWTPHNSFTDSGTDELAAQFTLPIAYSSSGTSMDYAITLETTGEEQVQLLFLGATGQCVYSTENDIPPAYFEPASQVGWDEPD